MPIHRPPRIESIGQDPQPHPDDYRRRRGGLLRHVSPQRLLGDGRARLAAHISRCRRGAGGSAALRPAVLAGHFRRAPDRVRAGRHQHAAWVMPAVAAANALAAWAASWGLQRWGRIDPALSRLRDVLWLGIGGGIGSAVDRRNAGVSAMWLAGRSAAGGYAGTWLRWSMGSIGGVLVVTPLALAWGAGTLCRARRSTGPSCWRVSWRRRWVSAWVFFGAPTALGRTWIVWPCCSGAAWRSACAERRSRCCRPRSPASPARSWAPACSGTRLDRPYGRAAPAVRDRGLVHLPGAGRRGRRATGQAGPAGS